MLLFPLQEHMGYHFHHGLFSSWQHCLCYGHFFFLMAGKMSELLSLLLQSLNYYLPGRYVLVTVFVLETLALS